METRPVEVVYFMRGPTYIHGELARPFTVAALDATADTRKFGVGYAELAAGLEQMTAQLSALPHMQRLILVTENPELDFKAQEAIARPFDRFGLSLRKASVSRTLHDRRMGAFEAVLTRVANATDKAIMVDADNLFCDRTQCYVFRNGVWLYADDDHLSVDGSRILAKRLEPEIFGP